MSNIEDKFPTWQLLWGLLPVFDPPQSFAHPANHDRSVEHNLIISADVARLKAALKLALEKRPSSRLWHHNPENPRFKDLRSALDHLARHLEAQVDPRIQVRITAETLLNHSTDRFPGSFPLEPLHLVSESAPAAQTPRHASPRRYFRHRYGQAIQYIYGPCYYQHNINGCYGSADCRCRKFLPIPPQFISH